MSRETIRVTFQPEGRSVFVLKGASLVEAAGQAGIIINQPCGGEGTCGKCRVEVLENAPGPTPADRRHFSAEQLQEGWRLACRMGLARDVVVSIPQDARFFEQMVLTEGEGVHYPFSPGLSKQTVSVPPATVEDQRSHADRLRAALGADADALRAELPVLRRLGRLLADDSHELTVLLEGQGIRWLEPGDTTGALYGVAFDVGTTTIAASLLDLSAEGRAAGRAVASATNPQVHFGDDVVSRISYIQKNPDGLQKLRRRLLTTLNELVLELCSTADVEPESVYQVVAVGNTTMAHILLDIDPGSIGQAPYVTTVREGVDVSAAELGLEINPNARLHVLPGIAGFVGSDTVGVVLASGMARQEEVQLAIDIGTNGEVVIGNSERLIACSCAAGPAFEGARIRHGMRATEGAVSKVVLNDAGLEVGVIGGGRASGICGSGLVDAVAVLLEAEVIQSSGRIRPAAELEDVPQALRQAVVEVDGQPAVVLVPEHSSKTGGPVLLTQRDVREVQLAKAAVQAGIQVVAAEWGVEPAQVDRVLLAGGFGNFIRRSHAKRIGLLPQVHRDRIEYIGNAALTGAKVSLACRQCCADAERISRTTRYVELANRADFQSYYMEAMAF